MVTYEESGVSIEAGKEAVNRIESLVKRTYEKSDVRDVGGFGGFCATFKLPGSAMVHGLATDGVGSKIQLAVARNMHTTVGIDLVAMCANDLVAGGVKPKVFVDYAALAKQFPLRTEKIVQGIARGCSQAGMALVGGEMAELPGLIRHGHYDLAGCAYGVAENEGFLFRKSDILPGMHVYGWLSTGVHSNGFSLIRRVFDMPDDDVEQTARVLRTSYPELGCTLGKELMRPTKIYVREALALRKKHWIVGLAHITGGGLIENPPRITPKGTAMQINLHSWEVPQIFRLIQRKGNVFLSEMLKTFNMGIGMIAVSPQQFQEPGVVHIGKIVKSDTSQTQFIGGQDLLS